MGMIFDLQRFSLNDGPGIRTTVFLKGCPLDCPWCHNPESKSPLTQLAYFAEKCTLCGACSACGVHTFKDNVHQIDRAACRACGKCAELCLNGALKVYGYESSAPDIVAEAKKDISYYEESGGGLTVSGGEPLYQPRFTLEILQEAKRAGLHTALETSGFGSRENLADIMPYCDLFLYDYKAPEEIHERLVGVKRTVIDQNLAFLLEHGAQVLLRCPIIPGINEDEKALKAYAAQYPALLGVEKLPYHNMGEGKKRALEEKQKADV